MMQRSGVGYLGFSLAGVAICCALFVPVAWAGWLPPVDLSESGDRAGGPQVVLDSGGNATAVWNRWNGTDTVVESAYRPAGKGWQAPVDLSEPELEGEIVLGAHSAQAPQIAVDGDGNVTVVWERAADGKTLVQSVDRPAGGSWTTPVDIGEMNQGLDPEPWIAVDLDGDAMAVWKQGEVIRSAFRSAGEEWGAVLPISPGESFVPQAAMNAAGDTTAVWMHFDGSSYVVESAFRPAGGEWEAPTLVSRPGEGAGNPHIALDADGDTLVAWRGEDEGEEFVRTSYRTAGGSWEFPTNASAKGEQVQAVRDAVDPEGNAIVAWAGNAGKDGGHDIVRAAYRPGDGGWGAPVELSADGGNAFPADLVFDNSGNAAIVWQRWDGTTNLAQAAYRPAGGEWEPAVDLSEEGRQATDAVVVLDAPGEASAADGNATAIWVSENDDACGDEKDKAGCRVDVVQAAGYDPDGLPVVELEAPVDATVGEPVAISTPTAGLFSPLIDFGDGHSVADTEALHSYAEPGEYTVSVAGAEVLGYRSSAQQTITVLRSGSESEPDSETPPLVPTDSNGSIPAPPGPPSDSTPALGPSGNPTPALGTSPRCDGAQATLAAARTRLRLVVAKLGRAEGSRQIRRLSAVKRKQLDVVRRAKGQAAGAC